MDGLKVGDRVRLSAQGEEQFPRMRFRTGVIRLVQANGHVIVQRDGSKQRAAVNAFHPDFWERVDCHSGSKTT
jgi:hypothetical protein